jgi:Ca2+-binding RTX toxin-like protein
MEGYYVAILTSAGNNANGTSLADLLFSAGGNDNVLTGAGNDTVYAGSGADTVNAGDGNDFVYGDAGSDQLSGGGGDDKVLGGAGDDTIVAGPGNDILAGGDGNDTFLLSSGFGNDTILDFTDGDTLAFSPGLIENSLSVHVSSVAELKDATADLQIDLAAGDSIKITFESGDTLVLQGIADEWFGTSALDGNINGTSGNDTLFGGEGANVILAGNGSDFVSGGGGDDNINAGNGNDIAYGGNGNDLVSGGAGNDKVGGGAGNDIIQAGPGDDVLSGDGGNDRFQFAGDFDHETVTDFEDGIDLLAFAPGTFEANRSTFAHTIGELSDLVAASNGAVTATVNGHEDAVNIDFNNGNVVTLIGYGDEWHALHPVA